MNWWYPHLTSAYHFLCLQLLDYEAEGGAEQAATIADAAAATEQPADAPAAMDADVKAEGAADAAAGVTTEASAQPQAEVSLPSSQCWHCLAALTFLPGRLHLPACSDHPADCSYLTLMFVMAAGNLHSSNFGSLRPHEPTPTWHRGMLGKIGLSCPACTVVTHPKALRTRQPKAFFMGL
jgi:hypothetical protein